MKTVMVVPTYWERDSETGWQLGDEIYDHPTPVDREGTLGRLLDSMDILDNYDFELIILVAVTAPELKEEAYTRVKEIVEDRELPVKTYIVGDLQLEEIKKFYRTTGADCDLNLLSLKGYSSIRNMCLYTSFLLEAEVVVLIDDDEVFKDPAFMDKIHEFIGGRLYGQTIDGVAGYYLNKNYEYYDDVEIEAWMTYWNRFGSKSKAFDKIIGNKPRLKQTPFAFGGLMVIHKNLFKVVPFDPELTRGEDIDYVLNARMFGFNFFLDNELSILHLPPGKHHPVWQRFRQDMYRFYYERAKIDSQIEISNMTLVNPEDFDPYPGEFLKPDLEDKVFKTNIILALDYLSDNQVENAKSTIKNIYLSKYDAEPDYNVFQKYLQVQKNWEKILDFAADYLYDLSEIIKQGSVSHLTAGKKIQEEVCHYENIRDLPLFKSLSDGKAAELLNYCECREYSPEDIILEKGDIDDTLYMIQRGRVKILCKQKEHEDIPLGEREAGDFFGLTSLISERNTHYLVDIIATEPAMIVSVNRQDLMKFFEENHESTVSLLLFIIKELNKQLENLTEMYTDMHTKTHDILSNID